MIANPVKWSKKYASFRLIKKAHMRIFQIYFYKVYFKFHISTEELSRGLFDSQSLPDFEHLKTKAIDIVEENPESSIGPDY